MIAIASVTVLEDRAAVTRRGVVAVPAGQHRVVIEGVSPVIADKTLAASAAGARVLDARVERFVAPWREGDGEVAEIRRERTELDGKRLDAEARASAARAESAALEALVEGALRDLAVAATRGETEAMGAAHFTELDGQDRAARARAAE
ncbi:MAG TPA: DUF4140 domain-containing protein, partial [Byssovorax sp.]